LLPLTPLTFLHWTALAAGVLLVMALAASYVRYLPITSSLVYLALGVGLGPLGLGVVELDLVEAAPIVEHVTTIAVVIALFVGGLRLRLSLRDPAWRAAYVLAGPVMVASIAGLAAVAHLALGLPFGLSLLIGAVLAPTDPVLASAVSVNDADDGDRMRYGLSGEAGLNDGMAFPFVVLALAWDVNGGAGAWLATWAAERLVWAVPIALALGYALGKVVGRLAIWLRARHRDTDAPNDLLALALMGMAYVGAEAVHAWGFLAVFAAGLGLRGAEIRVVRDHPHPDAELRETDDTMPDHPPAEALVSADVQPQHLQHPSVAAGVIVSETLSFGVTVERLVEVGLIVAVGVALGTHFEVRAIPLALALFVVIRPLAARVALGVTSTTAPQRWLMAWFGIRGIGSLYYLAYAITHGVSGTAATELAAITVSVIAVSIVVHGISSTPLLRRYEHALAS
jgi:NhaP-type Na+/H+ or K+/H+ antiporter